MLSPNIVPASLAGFTEPFDELFSHNQFNRFQEYLSGLIIGEDKNILDISHFIDRNKSYDNIHHFISNSNWDTDKFTDKMIDVIKADKHLAPMPTGWLVIDDVIIEKFGKKMEKVGKLYDHSEGRYLNYAHCLVQLSYIDARGIGYPLKTELYIKKDILDEKDIFKTKNEIAEELVLWAKRKGILFQGVLFDGWYLNDNLTEYIENIGKTWISRMKSNRIINFKGKNISVKDYAENHINESELMELSIKRKNVSRKFRYHSKCFKVKSLKNKKVRLVFISEYDEKKKQWSELTIFATNQITWHTDKIIKSYLLRWSIETFFRDSKQHLGLGDYQMRKINGIKRHWSLVSLAYVFLIKMRVSDSLFKMLSHQLRTVGHICAYYKDEIFKNIINWSFEQFQDNKQPEDLIKLLNLNSQFVYQGNFKSAKV